MVADICGERFNLILLFGHDSARVGRILLYRVRGRCFCSKRNCLERISEIEFICSHLFSRVPQQYQQHVQQFPAWRGFFVFMAWWACKNLHTFIVWYRRLHSILGGFYSFGTWGWLKTGYESLFQLNWRLTSLGKSILAWRFPRFHRFVFVTHPFLCSLPAIANVRS